MGALLWCASEVFDCLNKEGGGRDVRWIVSWLTIPFVDNELRTLPVVLQLRVVQFVSCCLRPVLERLYLDKVGC